MTYHRIFIRSKTTGVTSGAPSRAPDVLLILVFRCGIFSIIVCLSDPLLQLYCLSYKLRLLIIPMVSSSFFFYEYSLHLVHVLGLNIYFECHFIFYGFMFHHCCLVSLACERFTVHSKYLYLAMAVLIATH